MTDVDEASEDEIGLAGSGGDAIVTFGLVAIAVAIATGLFFLGLLLLPFVLPFILIYQGIDKAMPAPFWIGVSVLFIYIVIFVVIVSRNFVGILRAMLYGIFNLIRVVVILLIIALFIFFLGSWSFGQDPIAILANAPKPSMPTILPNADESTIYLAFPKGINLNQRRTWYFYVDAPMGSYFKVSSHVQSSGRTGRANYDEVLIYSGSLLDINIQFPDEVDVDVVRFNGYEACGWSGVKEVRVSYWKWQNVNLNGHLRKFAEPSAECQRLQSGAVPQATPAVSVPPTPSARSAGPQWATSGPWMKNHRITEMWSGPDDQEGVMSFGKTSTQFCAFQQRDEKGNRLYVFNPYSENYFWIDRDAVGPSEVPPVRLRIMKPPDQNCADGIFDG